MADSASELESDCSSIDGTSAKVQIPASKEQLQKRIESLHQECKVLKVELETYKLRCKNLSEENKNLRKASVTIQAKAEQEEEFISNMLLKKIQVLKKEKEALAMNYEQEEEFLTNDLSRKLSQLKQEKVHLEKTLEHEQEIQVNKLLRKIRKLEAETTSKQADLEQLRREKIELENTLEQEQESLVNRLWKRMEKLEAEKRILQEKLDQPVSEPPSPQPPSQNTDNARSEAAILSRHVQQLKTEVARLKRQLTVARTNHYEKMEQYNREEMNLRHESQSIKKKYMEDVALTRTLSESESSVDMEDENRSMDQSPYAPPSTNQNYPSTPRANRNAPSPSILANRSVSPMNICVSPNLSNQYKSPQHLCTNCGFTLPCTTSFNHLENPATITRCKRSPSAEIFAKPPLPPPPTLYSHSFDVPAASSPANTAGIVQTAKGQQAPVPKKESVASQGETSQAKRKETDSSRNIKDKVIDNTSSASI